MENIYWTLFQEGEARFLLAATERGLCYSAVVDEELQPFKKWVTKHYKHVQLIEDAQVLLPYIEQFTRFMRGEQQQFTFALELKGTAFQQQVWAALAEIPYGDVVSYQHIAEQIGNAKAVRAVGGAIGANPVMIVIPCHRVIGKNGTLTGFSSGLAMKELLLALEKRHAAQ